MLCSAAGWTWVKGGSRVPVARDSHELVPYGEAVLGPVPKGVADASGADR